MDHAPATEKSKLPRLFGWEGLWRYSSSSLVNFSAYATLIIPIIAEISLRSDKPLNLVAGVFTNAQIHSETANVVSWQASAALLYFGAFTILVARHLTQIFCPSRVARFPYQEDYLIFISKINFAVQSLKSNPASELSEADLFLMQAYEDIWKEKNDISKDHNKKWEVDNASHSWLRFLIGALYSLGTLAIISYLILRSEKNFDNVIKLLSPTGS